jgi:(p)ppGpp synthase/HD superfamily hydrolase
MGEAPDLRSSRPGPRQEAAVRGALELAVAAHDGQVDKGGLPYIEHCLTVAHRAYDAAIREGWSIERALLAYSVGLLHDTLEDCPSASFDMVFDAIGARGADAVLAMTHRKGEAREDYIARLSRDEIANLVKRCDLSHNMDLGRLANPTKADHDRREKYDAELKLLTRAALNMADRKHEDRSEPASLPNDEGAGT